MTLKWVAILLKVLSKHLIFVDSLLVMVLLVRTTSWAIKQRIFMVDCKLNHDEAIFAQDRFVININEL